VSVDHLLFYGHATRPLARVFADGPLYRIDWPDGSVSDICNLSRAKDAAMAIAERGPPTRNRRMFHWKKKASKRRLEASPIRFSASEVSRPRGTSE
jgi:hypothetical protein